MRKLTITRCSRKMTRVLALAKKADIVLRTTEGTEALVSLIDDFDYEIAAQRQNKELMASLSERFRRARKEKGISLEEACRRLGMPHNSRNGLPPREERNKTIKISRRSHAIFELLEQVRSEDLILRTPYGSEYSLTAVRENDLREAKNRRSEAVMAYLNELGEQGKLQPLEVVFVREWPLRKVRSNSKPKQRTTKKK